MKDTKTEFQPISKVPLHSRSNTEAALIPQAEQQANDPKGEEQIEERKNEIFEMGQMSDSPQLSYFNTQNKNMSKILQDIEKMESSINFDNRNLINESSVEEIHSNSDQATTPNDSKLDVFNLGEESVQDKKARQKRKNCQRVRQSDPDYIKIVKLVNEYDRKQRVIQETKDKINKKQQLKDQQELVSYQFLKFFRCIKEEDNEKLLEEKDSGDKENQENEQKMEREWKLMKLLNTRSEEQNKMVSAQKHWRMVRKKIKIIQMMGRMGGSKVHDMIMRKQVWRGQRKNQNDEDTDVQRVKVSKLIISPDNYWNLQWNNLVQVLFVIYIFLYPVLVASNIDLDEEHEEILIVFDFLFIIDRILDLFVGYYNSDGSFEPLLYKVIQSNLDSKIFLEIFISFSHLFFFKLQNNRNSVIYGIIKFLRYGRLFEVESQIDSMLEFYGQTRTVFEIKQMAGTLGVLQFSLQTMINLHILTCMMMILSLQKGFEESFIYANGIEEDDFEGQYIIAIYFVTTTLSTCGFGDISASPRDPIESGAMFLLQFVGMLFYSMTIQKIQSFLVNDEIAPQEYANHMVEVLENLVVKVGRQLPVDQKITGNIIQEWRMHTLSHFRISPNAFLYENEFYQLLPSNMKVRVIKDNLLEEFQQKFDMLFLDPEFNFRADDKLITELASCLTYQHQSIEDPNHNFLELETISKRITLIFEGEINMYYKNNTDSLTTFQAGSYFGEISYLFKIQNQFRYQVKKQEGSKDKSDPTQSRFFSLNDEYLAPLFDEYPDFHQMLKIRALRRYTYFRKLKNQQTELMKIRDLKTKENLRKIPTKKASAIDLLNIPKARLIEDKVPYEKLKLNTEFSDDEVTFELNREIVKEKKDKSVLLKIKKLEGQVKDLKSHSIQNLLSYIHTIRQMDQHSKKMVFKKFDSKIVNSFERNAPHIERKIEEIVQGSQQPHQDKVDLESDQIESDTSGNDSENDEMNQLSLIRSRLITAQVAVSDNSSNSFTDASHDAKKQDPQVFQALQEEISQYGNLQVDMADRIISSQRIDRSPLRRKSSYNHQQSRPMKQRASPQKKEISHLQISQHVNRHKEMIKKSSNEKNASPLPSHKSQISSYQTSPI